MDYEISFTDNSHLFGVPIEVVEGIDLYIEIPILDNGVRDFAELRQWAKKFAFFQRVGIDCHAVYKEKGGK